MADTVRYLMEEMIPELEDMVKQQYFSKQEVKQIVKRRQDFEYLLKRKAALKEDFLRYIEYESKLDALRAHRREALGLEGKKKKTLADFAIVRRIHFIFERAVRKFKTDISLWTAWLEFCRTSNSNRRLGRVVARALQIHPTEPGLWVYAAAWEFEHNANPAAARALMQQGLRMCRHCDKMWLDYFDLELMYVEKLVARRRILGLDVPNPDTDDDDQDNEQQQQQQQQGSEADTQADAGGPKRRRGAAADAAEVAQQGAAGGVPAEDDGEGPESAEDAAAAAAAADPPLSTLAGGEQQNGEQQQQQQQARLQEAQAAMKAVLKGAVARLVFQQALKAAAAATSRGSVSSSNFLKPQLDASSSSGSSGLQFRAGFLQVLRRYTSPGVAQLQQEILDSIRRDFPMDPAAADLLARIACDPSDVAASTQTLQAALQEFEHLLTHSSSTPAPGAEAGNSKPRASKRQKKSAAAPQAAATDTGTGDAAARTAEGAVGLPASALQQVYQLYCGYLQERLQALAGQQQHALAAAGVAQQLFKVMLRAHTAGAADEALYTSWVELAKQLKQDKVALKAARLATETHPTSAAAWEVRVSLEARALGCSADGAALEVAAAASGGSQAQQQQQQQQQLFALVMQALQKVPAAAGVQLWRWGLALARQLAAGGSSSQLGALQQLLVSCVTAAAVKGPSSGGLGAVAGECLQVVWQVAGAAAARKLWQQLLLLPPAGGDMFRVMVNLEQSADLVGEAQQQQQQRPMAAESLKRVRAVFEVWASAFGGSDATLWVEWAEFEQRQGKAGAGKVYWRAVKALDEPEEFIQTYRQQLAAV